MKKKTQLDWAITEYKDGHKSSCDSYINPYRPETTSFSNFEQGYFDGREKNLNSNEQQKG